jgi:hypothetical protein
VDGRGTPTTEVALAPPLRYVRQGYLAGGRRMALTKPIWDRGPFADIESGMRMAALMHCWGRGTLPVWPEGRESEWPHEILNLWLTICLSGHFDEALSL